MRRVGFRPFGVVVSLTEILAGLYLIWSVAASDELYPRLFRGLVVAVGLLLIAAGVMGVVHVVRRRVQATVS